MWHCALHYVCIIIVYICMHNVSLQIMNATFAIVNSIIGSIERVRINSEIIWDNSRSTASGTGSIMHSLYVWLTYSFSFAISYIVTEKTGGQCGTQKNMWIRERPFEERDESVGEERSRPKGQCGKAGEDSHWNGAEQNGTLYTIKGTQSKCCVAPAIVHAIGFRRIWHIKSR